MGQWPVLVDEQLQPTSSAASGRATGPSYEFMQIIAVDRPAVTPFEMPDRFRLEIVYFMTVPGEHGAPAALPEHEYWIAADEARQWLDDLVVSIVSPLDAAAKAEIPLTDYHEAWLEWLLANDIRHVRLV